MVCLHGFPIMTYRGLVQLHWHCKPGRNGTLRVTCQTDYLPRQERKVSFGQLPLKKTPVTSNHTVPQLTKQTCCVITSSTFIFLTFFISSPSTSTHWYTTSLISQVATKTVKQNTTSWSLIGQLATKTVKQNTISWSLIGQLARKTVNWTAVHASFSLSFQLPKKPTYFMKALRCPVSTAIAVCKNATHSKLQWPLTGAWCRDARPLPTARVATPPSLAHTSIAELCRQCPLFQGRSAQPASSAI